MAQARHITVLDSLTHRMQEFLHALGVAGEADAATGSAAAKADAEESMSRLDPNVTQKADKALGSVLFAIEAFGRHGLLVVADRLRMLRTIPEERSYAKFSDEALRKVLSRYARQLRKTNPFELIELSQYLVDFSQTQLEKAGD